MSVDATIADLSAKLDVLLSRSVVLPRYLSVKDAASYAGVSADSIRRLLDSGKLRRLHPVPGSVRIDREELDDYLQSTADGCHGGGRGRWLKENAGRGKLSGSPRPATGEVLNGQSTA